MPRKTGCQYPYDPLLDGKHPLIAPIPDPLMEQTGNPPAPPLFHPFEIDDQHPSFYAALEHLMIYERWVSQVVLPIAFRWIDENRSEVYAGIKDEYKDDIGVVINAAFNAVTKKIRIQGDHIPRLFNPTWVKIIEALQKARSEVLTTDGNPAHNIARIATDEQVPA